MQRSSFVCCSNSPSPSLSSKSTPQLFIVPFTHRSIGSLGVAPLPFNYSQFHTPNLSLSSFNTTATQEIVETSPTESDFIEIGYICSVHGLEGEVRVKPNTGFPELRFSTPGRRWLRQQYSGREIVEEVELVEGRGHPGQKGWIVRFSHVDTVEKAQQLIGSTVLITEDNRPELEEGEFYTRDLVGMKVVLKETGDTVGTVVNVFNSGANDLLHVRLNSSTEMPDRIGKFKSETSPSGPLVWVPFVEAIVPHVDVNKREMLITPPKGLLELNVRADERSKKERRQLEWKERKKLQKRLIAAKKKLCEMEQQHIFHGFRLGERAQTSLLAEEIVGVNSKLLQLVLQNIKMPSTRWNLPEFISANFTNQMRSTFQISEERLTSGSGEVFSANSKLQENSRILTSEGKVAIVLVVDDSTNLGSEDSPCVLLETLLSDDQRLVKIEDRKSVPLVLVCPAHEITSVQELFSNNDHFAFDSKKVWFLEEEKLPVVNSSSEEQSKHKILMKSPWEILQTPVGSGGIISLLSSHKIAENLSEGGVDYIEVCNVNERIVGGQSLLGLVNSCKSLVGIQIFKDMDNIENDFHMIFSMKFMNQLTKQMDKLHFHAIPKPNPHVEKVDKEWVDITPSSPNSYELQCSIYSSLSACPPNKVCLMEIIE